MEGFKSCGNNSNIKWQESPERLQIFDNVVNAKKTSDSPPVREKLPNPFVLLEDCNRFRIVSVPSNENDKEKSGKGNGKKQRKRREMENVLNSLMGGTEGKSAKDISGNSRDNARKRKKRKRKADAEFEVEKIVGHRRDGKGRVLYLVKWKGWPEKSNTYEPAENLVNCNRCLAEYYKNRKGGRSPVSEVAKTKAQIMKATKKKLIWRQLKTGGFSKSEWTSFFDNKFDLGKIFDRDADLIGMMHSMRRELNLVVQCLSRMGVSDDDRAPFDRTLFDRAKDYCMMLGLIESREKQMRSLTISEAEINSIEGDAAEIRIENDVDLDPFPVFHYVSGLTHGKEIVVPVDPPLGCDCSSAGCSPTSVCCGKLAGFEFAYSPAGKLRFPRRIPIYECNRKCSCSMDCPNRVVQKGRKVSLAIFKTDLRGWGVKSLQKINRGTFVCEYLGELIGETEAILRDSTFNLLKTSYLFDLDFNPDRESAMFCIDTMNHGNVSRFINHSCDPNLTVHPVWIDCLDPNLPRLAFFANRNIEKNEEINFDYENFEMEADSPRKIIKQEAGMEAKREMPRVPCLCKSANCRKWLFGSRVGE